MRLTLAIAVLLALVVAAPAAEGKRHGAKHRKALRGDAGRSRASGASAWLGPHAFVRPVAPQPPAATPDPVATPTATPEPTVPEPSTRSVSVVSREYSLTLSQTTVDAGDVRIQFDNTRAEDPHQLMVTDGTDLIDFGELGPGEVKRLTVPLKTGTYQLLCPLPDHEAMGMRARLTVR
jgi:plastocyanin